MLYLFGGGTCGWFACSKTRGPTRQSVQGRGPLCHGDHLGLHREAVTSLIHPLILLVLYERHTCSCFRVAKKKESSWPWWKGGIWCCRCEGGKCLCLDGHVSFGGKCYETTTTTTATTLGDIQLASGSFDVDVRFSRTYFAHTTPVVTVVLLVSHL